MKKENDDLSKKNVDSHVVSDLKRHVAYLKINGRRRKFFLIKMMAKTNIMSDLKKVFGRKFDEESKKRAVELFGNDERHYCYGVFFDGYGKVVFAFNMLFAKYERLAEKVVYQDLTKFLNETPLNPLDLEKKIQALFAREEDVSLDAMIRSLRPSSGWVPGRHQCGKGLISYSLPDPADLQKKNQRKKR